MICLPEDPTTEPGCLLRDAGTNAEGHRLFQAVLWVNAQCFVSVVRTKSETPTLANLQRFFATHPHHWTPVAHKPTT